MLPTPVFWPREVHGLYTPWSCKESNKTEQISLHWKEISVLLLFLKIMNRHFLSTKGKA